MILELFHILIHKVWGAIPKLPNRLLANTTGSGEDAQSLYEYKYDIK